MEQRHFDIVNHATPRLESMDKALGRGKYTDDLELPNMAYAALVRCPYSHAKVLSIDVSEAEKVPGFLGCALPEEAPQAYFNCSGNPPSPLLMADEKVLTRMGRCSWQARPLATLWRSMRDLRSVRCVSPSSMYSTSAS